MSERIPADFARLPARLFAASIVRIVGLLTVEKHQNLYSASASYPSRTASIDFVRLFAAFGIILIHSEPFRIYPNGFGRYLFLSINQASRFAVPCFFMLAGYYWGKKIVSGASLSSAFRGYGSRILFVFLFWSVAYWALPDPHHFQDHAALEVLQEPAAELPLLLNNPVQLLFEGTEVHLWFLPALLSAVALVTVCLQLKLTPTSLLLLGAALYAFGLLAGSYAPTPWGVSVSFNARNGPFFATLPFVLGWWLSHPGKSVSFSVALSLLFGGLALQLLESFLLWQYYGAPAVGHDYLLGTLPFGVGVALLALSRPSLGRDFALTKYGRYALGIYAIHYLFVDNLPMADTLFFSAGGQLLFPVTVFTLALLTAVLISKVPGMRRLVA